MTLRRIFAAPPTVFVIVCLGAALYFLQSGLLDKVLESRHFSSGRLCFVHVGSSEKAMPAICVSGEARTPDEPGVIAVNLTSDDIIKFANLVEAQNDAPANDRVAFGSYELSDSIKPDRPKRLIGRTEMQILIEELLELMDSDQRIEKATLTAVLRTLA